MRSKKAASLSKPEHGKENPKYLKMAIILVVNTTEKFILRVNTDLFSLHRDACKEELCKMVRGFRDRLLGV